MTPQQEAEFARRIDHFFEQLRPDRPHLIGKPESPQQILADVRRFLTGEVVS